jgi:membrane peptidoglycan carboxypeptidase
MSTQTYDPPPVRHVAPPPVPPVVPPPAPRSRRPRRSLTRAALLTFGVGVGLLVLLAAPVVIALAKATDTADATIAAVPPLPDDLASPPERSVVVDREGRRLATLQVENRRSVTLDRVPDHVIDAVLATEDQTFWEHRGVNWSAIMRAAVRNASDGEITGGGSTITQQLVKNRVVGDERTLQRKITEAVYASRLEREREKREILEMYLNDTYFGNGAYGIATAAEYYWRKPVTDLNLSQAALLAGMIRAPERNDPVDNPENALARRGVVLAQMTELGIITPRQARQAGRAALKLRLKDQRSNGAPFLIDVVRRELEADERLGATPQERWNTVLTDGLKIRTTFDKRLQTIAKRTIRELLPNAKTDPMASVVAVDAATGDLLTAAVGPKHYGDGARQTTINPAIPGLGGSGRQPGSTFKAFELVAALEHDVPTSYGFDSTTSTTSESPQCPGYEVTNYGGADLGVQRMAEATATSSNTYFLHLMDIAGGPEALAKVAKRMGVTSEVDPHCSLVLGAEEVYPVEMAGAFATLANDGVRCRPHAVAAIRDRDGEVLRRRRGKCRRVLDRDVSRQATDLLRGPVERGTASARGQIGRPAAGKTGTTTNGKDAWFVGFTPQVSAATWVGHEVPKPLVHPLCGEVTGGCLPTILWQRFMTAAVSELGLEAKDFPAPPPPPARAVPDVTGMAQDDAVQTLMESGFLTEAVSVPGDQQAGTVVGQDPGAGVELTEGGTVRLDVSDGMGIVEEPEPEPDEDDWDDGDQPDEWDFDVPPPPDLPDLPDGRDWREWREGPPGQRGRGPDFADQW